MNIPQALTLVLLLTAGARAEPAAPDLCANPDADRTREQILRGVPPGDAWNIALARNGLYQKGGQWWLARHGGEITVGPQQVQPFQAALRDYCSEASRRAAAAERVNQEAERRAKIRSEVRAAPPPGAAETRMRETDLQKKLARWRAQAADLAAPADSAVLSVSAPAPNPACAQACTATDDCDAAGIGDGNLPSEFKCRQARAAIKTYACSCR